MPMVLNTKLQTAKKRENETIFNTNEKIHLNQLKLAQFDSRNIQNDLDKDTYEYEGQEGTH